MKPDNSECRYDGLKADLYEFTMVAGYYQNNYNSRATFELSCHTMPTSRGYFVACGLSQALRYILQFMLQDTEISFLKKLPAFRLIDNKFFEYLKKLKFTGNVWAMPEGEVFFAKEPIIQIEAPIIEAQLLETYLLSMINIQTLVATKATRVIDAAASDGRKRVVVDFGSRRAHGPEAGLLAARAAYIAGCIGTSNVCAGKQFNIPVYGTMAHSWVNAFDNELEAFRRYSQTFPEGCILLIDTYDTLKGAANALKVDSHIRAVRIDSGDLIVLSKKVRKFLDKNDAQHIKIIASGNLNEHKISDFIKKKAPIDIFGVGTDMVISRDCPALDLTYKLVEIDDPATGVKYTAKRSRGKGTVPARKQVFRMETKGGKYIRDIVGLSSDKPPRGTKRLLKQFVKGGKIIKDFPTTQESRQYAAESFNNLPKKYKELHPMYKYPVEMNSTLSKLKRATYKEMGRAQ